MHHPACHRHEGRGDQRLKALGAGGGLAAAAAHQAEPRLLQKGCVVAQLIGVVQLHLHGLSHRREGGGSHGSHAGGDLLAGAVFDELAGEFLLEALSLLTAGQQQVALHLHQTRRHLDELAGHVQPVVRQGVDDGGVLVDQVQDGDLVQIHLVFAHQIEQKVQRALELFQFKGKTLHCVPLFLPLTR